jgi:hypothetical protein
MRSFRNVLYSRRSWLAFSLVALVFSAGVSLSTNNVSANHPVLVEGNCESPIPGTTAVALGVCGDFDGDGRVGTAEDTDGADRIFGTLRAALGPGTGAAAGTGANYNGTITIVTSGRFAESLFIGIEGVVAGEGTASPGNVTIEAAPGVDAAIDAVLQGDPAGGNNVRQEGTGIHIYYDNNTRRVILRNLTIRNWANGVHMTAESRVTIDSCRFENNRDNGVLVTGNSQMGFFNSSISATGFRVGTAANSTSNGHAIQFGDAASGMVAHSHITGNRGAPIYNLGLGAVTYYELFLSFNQLGIVGATRDNTP